MAAARPGAPQLLRPGTLLLLLPLLLVLPGGCRALEGEQDSALVWIHPTRFWDTRVPRMAWETVGNGSLSNHLGGWGGGAQDTRFSFLLAPLIHTTSFARESDLFCEGLAGLGEPLEMQASHLILEPFFLSPHPPFRLSKRGQ